MIFYVSSILKWDKLVIKVMEFSVYDGQWPWLFLDFILGLW